MLVPLSRLLRPGPRDADLRRLRARFSAQPSRRAAGASTRAQAERLEALKRQLAEAFDGVRACAGCAEGCAPPAGVFEGGRCCGTSTLEVFSQAEVRALRAAGREAPRAPAADGVDGGGCAFRGREGCALSPVERPTICLTYVCLELGDELDDHPDGARVAALRRALAEAFERFAR